MHDIDRTQMEMNQEYPEFSFETEDDFGGEYYGEFGDEFGDEFGEAEFYEYGELPFSQEEEMELAMELLSVGSEEELEQFLGSLFKKAWRGIKKAGSSLGRLARPLGGILKTVAKTALPVVGGAIGSAVAPGVGTAIGSGIGSMVGKALEAESARIKSKDKDLIKARKIVRLAGVAARTAAKAHPASNPAAVSRAATMKAIQKVLPKAKPTKYEEMEDEYYEYDRPNWRGKSGRWIRKGNKIILFGV